MCRMLSIATWSPRTYWLVTTTICRKWRSSTSASHARATSCRQLLTSSNAELSSTNHQNKSVMCSHTPRKQIYGRRALSCTNSSRDGIRCGRRVRASLKWKRGWGRSRSSGSRRPCRNRRGTWSACSASPPSAHVIEQQKLCNTRGSLEISTLRCLSRTSKIES